MRIAVLLMLAAFIILVHRYARMRFVIAYCIAGYVLLCCMSGCNAPYHYPPRAEVRIAVRPLTCGDLPRDGSYLLLRCTL